MEYPDYYTYPAILTFDDDGISIEFPDLPGCLSCADTIDEAVHNAHEVMGLYMYGLEEDGETIPEPANPLEVMKMLEGNQTLTLVREYMPVARAQVRKAYVKKMCTVPAWLVEEGKREGLNFSQVLQEGLMVKLGHQKRMR